jgi:hypothetical protein
LGAACAHGQSESQGLPNWPAYTREKRAVMLFDTPCRVENDPTGEGQTDYGEAWRNRWQSRCLLLAASKRSHSEGSFYFNLNQIPLEKTK